MGEGDIEELQRLWDLKEKGAISEDEFAQLKQRVLDQKSDSAESSGDQAGQPLGESADVPRKEPSTDAPWSFGKAAGIGIAIIFGLFVIIVAIGSAGTNTTSNTQDNGVGSSIDMNATAIDTSATKTDTNATAAETTPTSTWTYTQDDDKVRGGTTYFAMTTSTNSISQPQPYDSDTTMRMMVRKSPGYGTDVILTVSSGQMMCPSFEGCSGTVRFDNGAPQRVRFNGPADDSSDTVFLVGAKAFIAKLKTAKKVTIEKTLYQAGAPQFEFDVRGLKWNH